MEIFKLFGSIFVDNKEAEKSISSTDKKAESLGKRFTDGVKTAAKWGAGIATAAAGAGAALFALANKTTQEFDKISKNSTKLGVTTDAFQEMSYWASQNGIDMGNMERAVGRLNQRIGMAADGNDKYAKALERLGVDMEAVKEGTVSTEDAMYQAMSALSQMTSEQEKSAMAAELFGTKLARELMPALQDGSLTMEEAKQRAHELGIVIGEDVIAAGVTFQDNLTDLKASLSAVGRNIMSNLIPVFNNMTNWILDNMPTIQAVFQRVFGVIESVVGIVIDIVTNLINTFKNFFTGTEESGSQFQEYFQAFYEWLKEIFDLIVEIVMAALEAIQGFWKKHGDNIMAVIKPIFEAIKSTIKMVMDVIKGILKTALSLIRGDWSGAWEGIKSIFIAVWNGIKNILPSLLEGVYALLRAAFGIFKDLGGKMFNAIWDGMKGIWGNISGWVSDKVSWLTDKLMFWRKGNKEMEQESSGSGGVDGSHRSGLNYVPFDGYVAELHKGERVLTADENKALNSQTAPAPIVIQNMNVRSESDIKKIARELYNLQQNTARGSGVPAT